VVQVFKKQKYAFLLFAAIVMLALFAIVITVSNLNRRRVNRTLQQDYSQRIQVNAQQAATGIKTEVTALRDKLQFISGNEAIQSLNAKTCNARLEAIIAQVGTSMGNLGRIGPDGKFYCSVNKQIIGLKGETFGSYVKTIFDDPEHKPVISRAIKPTGSTSYLLAVHVPVSDSKGTFLGTFGGALALDKLGDNQLKNNKPSLNGFLSLLDDDGTILYHPQASIIGESFFADDVKALYENNQELQATLRQAMAGQVVATRYRAFNEERFAVYVPIEVMPGRRLIVSAVVPTSDINSLGEQLGVNRSLRSIALFVGVILLVLAVLLTVYLNKRIFRPLEEIVKSANSISNGVLDANVPVKGSYELVSLGSALNTMISRLRSYSVDLEKEVQANTRGLEAAKDHAETEKRKDDAILKSVAEGLVVVDEKGIITEVNPAAETLLKQKAETLVGTWYPKTVVLLNKQGEPLGNPDRPEMETILAGTPVKNSDYYLQRPDSRLPVDIIASPFMLENHLAGVIIVLRDITKERELDQAKDDFIALASHQLRTPATAIKQFVGMLLEGYAGKITAEQKDLLEQAYLSNERQINITQDMLNVAKLESGTLELQLEQIEMPELITKALAEQSFVVESRKQKLVIKKAANVRIQGDRGLLRMVIDNFVSNASKYTPEGGKITVSYKKAGKYVQLAIADNGVGISPENQKKLFRRFSRIKNELSTRVGGTGLGLYIAHKIIVLHGGSIYVDSAPGKGTTFTINLPVVGPHV
jgi:NtrC-family two-component system sensor histidine kinase KinB